MSNWKSCKRERYLLKATLLIPILTNYFPKGNSCVATQFRVFRSHIMHPDLINNSHFLKYYKQWQDDPDSIVFVPIVEYFLSYGMIDDAFKICRAGLKKHPSLVSGLLMMAKIHLKRGNWEEAEEVLDSILADHPHNRRAARLKVEVAELQKNDFHPAGEGLSERRESEVVAENVPQMLDPSWNTISMANIYAEQGHIEHARVIYKTILQKDPENTLAKNGLEALPTAES